jgi:2-polyprenyl-3-methyl-5-hydroxy-6-metoxy-1,4-benzoquinol methylase
MDSAHHPGRLPKLEGIDYKKAAIDYPGKLSAERLHHLRTKPFYNLANKLPKFRDSRGMDAETHREFCDFANIAVALELPPGARILDVACGSGWLSEYFARLGYDVTGIDISPDLIRISEDRVRGLPYGVDPETPLRCRFLVHDVERAPLGEKFDALVCYDAMHHFADEQAVARNLAAMLEGGGLLFILEGTRPPQDSPGEAELIDVMRRFETLESPFDAAYLRQILDQNGLAVVGDYVSINALIDREALDAEGRIRPHLPAINYLLCKKVAEGRPASSVPDSRMPSALSAAIELEEPPKTGLHPGATFVVRLKVANTGDTLWLGGNYMRRGAVMLGVKILDAGGKVVDEFHGEPALPRAMAPGESTTAVIERAAPAKPGAYSLKIDLVDQHICWFEERGSRPLVLPLEVR